MKDEDMRRPEYMRYESGRSQHHFYWNPGSWYGWFKRVFLLLVLFTLLDAFVFDKFLEKSLFESVFEKFVPEFDLNFIYGYFTIDKGVFLLLSFVVTFVLFYVKYPLPTGIQFALANWTERRFKVRGEIPITHNEFGKMYNGKREIKLIGESESFMTYDDDGSKSVMVKKIEETEESINLYLTKAYTLNTFQVLAVDDMLYRFSEDYGEVVKQNVALKHLYKAEAYSTSKELREVIDDIIDPVGTFRKLFKMSMEDKILNVNVDSLQKHVRVVNELKEGVSNDRDSGDD